MPLISSQRGPGLGSRRLLQVAVAIAGFVPVGTGLAGMLVGPSFAADGGYPVSADSHVRYLSGLLAAIGVAFWTTVPAIEHQAARFRLLTALVVTGGVGRMISLLTIGVPSPPMLFGLVMELGVTPALCFWQSRVASNQRSRA